MAVGYSLGGAMLLKYLGEEGAASPLAAAATVSAPIDLAVTCRYMMRRRNRLYHHYILGLMKVEATGEGAVVSAAERAAIMGARTVWDYDDVFIAPRYGFASAEDYYERCRPTRFMAGIRVPTLILSAMDDPWIPGALYSGYDWASNPIAHAAPARTRRPCRLPRHGQPAALERSGGGEVFRTWLRTSRWASWCPSPNRSPTSLAPSPC